MDWLDDQIASLHQITDPLTRKSDFEEFWTSTRNQTEANPLKPTRTHLDYPGNAMHVHAITYRGFDETPIHGWFLLPAFQPPAKKMPCMIRYHGFTSDSALPYQHLEWLSLGIAVLAVDCREQSGATGNAAIYSSGHTTNLVCKGILDKDEYYFRAVYMDAIKAIDFACAQPEVDPERIIIEGGSQGGAIGMAVCALDNRPWLAMVDVPSNSNLPKRVVGAHGSFGAVTDYLKRYPNRLDTAMDTLSYFDTMNMADRIQCPILASVGLKDPTCPAECYFSSYNRIPGEKEIHCYPFNGHEGGWRTHEEVKMRWLWEKLCRDDSADLNMGK